jgi:23S rRNA (guanosine2251-2'-O)-methyltransferase
MNLICGINPVLEALGAGTRHFERLLIVKGLRNRRVSEAISRASRLAVPLRFETRETLDRVAGDVPHQGIIAVVSAKPAMTLENLLATARDPALLVVLDGVEDPRNLGAILRTAEAAGADGVLLPERHSAGLSETVNRASAGALEHVRVARVGNVVQALEQLKSRGVWAVGFDATGTERWDAVDLKRPIALVLGGEGRGIRRLVREHCDHLASIPLFGHVGSINVSVAAGVALYEVVRQRGAVPSQVRPIPLRPPEPGQIVGPGADDAEHDPGARAGRGQAMPFSDGDDDGEEGDAPEEPLANVVDFHEEAAWTGPTVLKPAGFARDPRRLDQQRRRRPRPGGPARPADPEIAPRDRDRPAREAGSAGSVPETGRRRKRRRGRKDGEARPEGGPRRDGSPPRRDGMPRPDGVDRPREDQGRKPEGQGGPNGPAEGGPATPASSGPGGGVPGGGGKRRRRRRRH